MRGSGGRDGTGGAGRRILVVEDESLVRWSLTTSLEREGYRVQGVGSGEEALEYLEDAEVDLLILDVNLTGITGLELLSRLRDKGRRYPAIVVTAFEDGAMSASCEALGVRELVSKPFRLEEVRAAVERALAAEDPEGKG